MFVYIEVTEIIFIVEQWPVQGSNEDSSRVGGMWDAPAEVK